MAEQNQGILAAQETQAFFLRASTLSSNASSIDEPIGAQQSSSVGADPIQRVRPA